MFRSTWAQVAACLLCAHLAGCLSLPPYYQSLQKQTQTEMTDLSNQQVFYVTDRQLASGQFTAKPGGMTYGDCSVSVPAVHDMGNDVLTEQLSQALTNTKVGSFQLKQTTSTLSSSASLFSQFGGTFDGKHDLLLMVHGYNTTFAGAVETVGELSNDLGGGMVPIAFSWASQGTYEGYPTDENNVDGAARDLAGFLRDLLTKVPPDKVHLIVHSMGARVATGALLMLQHDAAPVLAKGHLLADLVFAAADMDATEFKKRLEDDGLAGLALKTTLYCSYDDRALKASYYFHGSQTQRAGEAGPQILILSDAETIDASLNDLSASGHSYIGDDRAVIEDLYMLLVLKQPANNRNLYHATLNDHTYWLIRP
jgi:esterase/lipase superfamily enzyme